MNQVNLSIFGMYFSILLQHLSLHPTKIILIFPQCDVPQDPSWSYFEEAVNPSASAPVEREVEISSGTCCGEANVSQTNVS